MTKKPHSFSVVMVTSHLVTRKIQRLLGRWRWLLPCEWGIFICPFLYFAPEKTGVPIPPLLRPFLVYKSQAVINSSRSCNNSWFFTLQLCRTLQISWAVSDFHDVSAVEFLSIQRLKGLGPCFLNIWSVLKYWSCLYSLTIFPFVVQYSWFWYRAVW
jgi:hypothetical protein